MYLTRLAAFCLLLHAGSALAGPPDFPPPRDAKVEWVGSDIVRNGIPMSIRLFRIEGGVEDVLAFYREIWAIGETEDEPGFKEGEADPWEIITRLEDNYMMSVQVQPDSLGGSWGYLGLSRLPIGEGARDHRPKSFPMMSGSKLVNDTETRDIGRKARTLMILNRFSVGGNAQFYRSHYEAQGWSEVMDAGTVSGRTHSLVFENGKRTVSLSIAAGEDGRTVVVANEETK